MPRFFFYPQFFKGLATYSFPDFRADVFAGVTVGIVALPLAMAFAIASGVSPEAGIFTAIIAGFLISFLGGTKLAIGGPTGAYIVILYAIVSKYGLADLLICTFMAGIMLLLMGVFKLGQIIKFFPLPLITGFTNGIAILILLTQLKDFLGLDVQMPSGFFATIETLQQHAPNFDRPTLLMSASCLLIILFWPKKWGRFLPAPFFVLLLGSIVTALFQLPIETIGSRFGGIHQGLPEFQWLSLDLNRLSDLMMPAFTIALLGAIESLLCAVVADKMTHDKHDSNQELLAQGIANMVVPFFGGIPATGAIARTAANIQNGGRTPMSGMVHAVLLLLMVLVAAPLASYIPLSVLAAILISVGLKMGDWDLRKMRQYPKSDSMILVVTFVLTLVFDLTVGVQIGLLFAAIFFIQRMAKNTQIHELIPEHALLFERHSIAGKHLPPQVHAYRIEGALFFGAVDRLQFLLEQPHPEHSIIILQLHRLVLLDTTGLITLGELYDALKEQNTTLILCGAGNETARMLKHSKLGEHIGTRNVQPDLAAAIMRAEEILADESTPILPETAKWLRA